MIQILAQWERVVSQFYAARDDFFFCSEWKKISSARADGEWNYKHDSAQTKSLIDSVSPFSGEICVYKKKHSIKNQLRQANEPTNQLTN